MYNVDNMLQQCINPKNVNYSKNKKTGYVLIHKQTFNPKNFNPNKPFYTFNCNKCLYCQQVYSKQWALRMMLENKHHQQSSFITLTYNNENVPIKKTHPKYPEYQLIKKTQSNSDVSDFVRANKTMTTLRKKHLQDFIKRYRKKLTDDYNKKFKITYNTKNITESKKHPKYKPPKIRYYAVGEYGGRKGRAHYHLVIFGHVPTDLTYLQDSTKGSILYDSQWLSKIWGKGNITIGIKMDLKSLKYTAKYLSKLSYYDPLYQETPFSVQSNRPGIGAKSWDLSMYETDSIYMEGKKYSIPKYFDRLTEKYGYDLRLIKEQRDAKIKEYGSQEITYRQKMIYKNEVEKQGYTMDHLFYPGSNSIKKLKRKHISISKGTIKKNNFNRELNGNIKYNLKKFLK